uniref:Uncharacterized protein n=1 Tax=Lepeophtheirus salmonis TaxID=72036 RepID=A0A0K2VGG1_LEPSM
MTEIMKMEDEGNLDNVAINLDPDSKDNLKNSAKRKRRLHNPIELHAQTYGILEEILREQKRILVSIMCTLLLFIVYQIFELYSMR